MSTNTCSYLTCKTAQMHPICEMLVTQSCPTPCDHMDWDLPGSSVHGILQSRILEWVAISFSRRSSRPRDWTHASALQADSLSCKPPGKFKPVDYIILPLTPSPPHPPPLSFSYSVNRHKNKWRPGQSSPFKDNLGDLI